MKNLFIIVFGLIVLSSCKKEASKTAIEVKKEIAPISDEILETAVIYEANIRQYSPEGSFDAFTKDIPQLKNLGVKIIWLMPINPISHTKRKGTGGDFASLIEDEEERAKMLGSYYAVSDYTGVNPEFGTIEDFRELIKTAHENDIYVILDWVPNHTGWDHVWIKEHPEFYVKNDKGEITDPLNDDGTSKGWGDVAQLDYTNMDMQAQMLNDMLYWVEQENVDGFRCDHIEPIPVSFWKNTITKLKEKRAIFMLAENDNPKFVEGSDLFEMEYGWKLHHLLNGISKGEKSVKEYDDLMQLIDTVYAEGILMNFVTNHDENSWNGTVKERMPNNKELFTALVYMVNGMPLIYSGQEYDLDFALKFFEKDQIPKAKGSYYAFLEKLGKLKNENSALNGGKNPASYTRIETSNENVLAFTREKDGNKVTFIGNLSDTATEFSISKTFEATNYLSGETITISSEDTNPLKAWEYRILVTE